MTNYSVERPSYGYTTATTQFDDALLRHGVVNRTQTVVAKGATVRHAEELLQAETDATRAFQNTVIQKWDKDDDDKGGDDDDDSYDHLLDDDDDDDDDEVLRRYRQLRLEEFQAAAAANDKSRNIVESIRRDEWTAKVNDVSRDGTRVVICLSTSTARDDFLEACTVLARRRRHDDDGVVFVTLPAPEALPDWPHPEPSILVYRYGRLWREFFRLTTWSSVDDLDNILRDVWEG